MGSENSPRFKRYLFCDCEAGICDLRPLKNDPKNRFFYKCLTPNCSKGKNNFLKFDYEVGENDLFVDVPNCSCNGGRCRVAREKEVGPNFGKIVFTCTIKEGQGVCKYRVYQDELLMMQQVDPNLNPSALNGYDDISDASPVVNTPEHLQRCEASWKVKQLQYQEMELGAFPLLYSPSALHVENTINSGKSTHVTKTPLRPENIFPLNKHDQNHVNFVASPNIMSNLPEIGSSSRSLIDRSTNAKIQRINPNVTSRSGNFILDACGQAAEVLQSKFLTFLKTMEAKDHESMRREANKIFYSLDAMFIDYRQFKEQVMELINSAKLLHEIEESIPENDSVQKLVDRFHSERKKLDEINCVHDEAVDTVENIRKRVEVIKDEISLTKDRLVRAEADLFHSEMKLREMENQLEQICNEKEVLKGKCDVASQEYQNCMDLLGVTEAERDIAKDVFDRARVSLTG